jgi:hypothetical protein
MDGFVSGEWITKSLRLSQRLLYTFMKEMSFIIQIKN